MPNDESVLEFATPQKLQQAATAAREAVEGLPSVPTTED
jgi:hypothetical protein